MRCPVCVYGYYSCNYSASNLANTDHLFHIFHSNYTEIITNVCPCAQKIANIACVTSNAFLWIYETFGTV
jgi:hypothetical protein